MRAVDRLTPHQRTVVDAFLAEREAERRHLVVSLSGAHAYGFPSPDSDVDLKAVHIAPIRSVLAIEAPPSVFDRIEVRDGVELDYGSNEVGAVLQGVLRGNGNFVERLLADTFVAGDADLLASLRDVVQRNLSRRFHRHYRGFAASQRAAADEKCTAKRVLYVLRTALTGAHLLRTGEVVPDLVALHERYGFDIDALIAVKVRGETSVLPVDVAAAAQSLMDRAFAALDAAREASVLPEDPPAPDAFDGWLASVRAREVRSRPVRRALDLVRDTVLLTVAGSRAFGLHRPDSDVDVKGVAIAPSPYVHGLTAKFEQAEGSALGVFVDRLSPVERAGLAAKPLEGSVYDLRKFLALASESNPNLLDVLFCRDDEVRVLTPAGRRLRDARGLFLSQRARQTFAGYASAQLKRIEGHRRWLLDPPKGPPERAKFGLPDNTLLPKDQLAAAEAAVRKQIARWNIDVDGLDPARVIAVQEATARMLGEMRTALGLASDDDTRWLAAARAVGLDANLILVMQREREYESAANQWRSFLRWKQERNVARAALEAAHGYDTKHASHLVRLLRMGREILRTGQVHVWRGPGGAGDAEELRAIRDGAWSYDALIAYARAAEAELDAILAEGRSAVPKHPDVAAIDALCQDLVEAHLFESPPEDA